MIFNYNDPIGDIEVIYSIVVFDIPIFYFGLNNTSKEYYIVYQYDIDEENETEDLLFIKTNIKTFQLFLSGKISTLDLLITPSKIMYVTDDYEQIVIKYVSPSELDCSKLPQQGYFMRNEELTFNSFKTGFKIMQGMQILTTAGIVLDEILINYNNIIRTSHIKESNHLDNYFKEGNQESFITVKTWDIEKKHTTIDTLPVDSTKNENFKMELVH